MKWINSHLLFCLAMGFGVLMVPRETTAQLAPTGGHYAGRASDTGYEPGMVNASGGYVTSVPLDLPPARGGLPVPLQIVSGVHGVGAAGLGWDVPLSYVRRDTSFAGRRPTFGDDVRPVGRERVSLSLMGRNIDLIRKGTDWIARHGAPELLLREQNGTWVLFDGQGRRYYFSTPSALTGTGLWLLFTITGPGGTRVQLDYDIDRPAVAGSRGISIDLARISYNYNAHPETGCTKHEVVLTYGAATTSPLSISILGDAVLARMRTLSTVDVKGRANCDAAPERLRRYQFSYLPDADTKLPRLTAVQMFGREGTTEATTPIPIASYGYGAASSGGKLIYQKTQSIPLPSMADAAQISSTALDLSVHIQGLGRYPYSTSQNLIDVTGDGRPDMVFRKDNQLWTAPNLPASGGSTSLGAVNLLSDATFTSGQIETRTSTASRFDVRPGDAHIDQVWRKAIDVNGDGRLDIIDAGEQAGRWVVYLNTPNPGPSGIKWVRRSFRITALYEHMHRRGLRVTDNYVPLTSRYTGRDFRHGYCFQWNGTKWNPVPFPTNGPCGGGGWPPVDNDFGPEKTYTEWDVTDVNGDGYPDFVFNRNPVDIIGSGPPSPLLGPPGTNIGVMENINERFTVQPTVQGGVANEINAVINLHGVLFDEDIDVFSQPITLKSERDRVLPCGLREWETNGNSQVVGCDLADVNGDGLIDRVEGINVYLGSGVTFTKVKLTLPGPFAIQQSDQVQTCVDPSPHPLGNTSYPAGQIVGMRDLTGDGIPDYIERKPDGSSWQVSIGTGTGFAAPIDIDGGFAFSFQSERCDGKLSSTLGGLYDIDGDGKPEWVSLNGGALDIHQLVGGAIPGTPEAGRLVQIDNGYGARTTIRYRSAKEDGTTLHQVPFPEVVVTSIETTGTQGLGGTLAATRYAYGGAELVFDSWLDAFTLPAYARSVELRVLMNVFGGNNGLATLTDTYPLAPFAITMTREERFGRYLRVGRVRDVTVLKNAGNDPWAMLATDIATDPRRIGATHYDWLPRLFEEPAQPNQDFDIDMVFPYDFRTSFGWNIGSINLFSAHGFLYGSATDSWRGDAAPPSSGNVATRSQVLKVDDYGRVTAVLQEKDRYRSDDDICVETKYAESAAQNERVLSAPASRRIWDCANKTGGVSLTYAAESWQYDNLPAGSVSNGFVTSHTIERRATDTGALLNTVRAFDASYDVAGNPTAITSKREDGAVRTITLDYDPFGLASTRTKINATGTPSMEVSINRDPVSLDALSVTDANQTQRGTDFDGFGRVVRSTMTPPGGALGVLSTVSYLGFSGGDPFGRRIVSKSFTDPVALENIGSASGRTSTVYFDELGRERRSELALGADYADQILIAGARSYDALGRVSFEADPFPSGQNATTAYGTTYFFKADGSPACFIRGSGPQPLSSVTNESTERYPTCFSRTFANHEETLGVSDAASLLSNSPQARVTRYATLTAVGRVLSRSTVKDGTRLEYATFTHDRLGQMTSMTRYQGPVNATNAVQSSWRFDSRGQVLQLQEPESATQFNKYNDWGELLEVQWTDNTTLPSTDRRLVNKYDALGRVTHREERNNGVIDPDTLNDYLYDVGQSVAPQVTPTNVMGRLAQAKAPTGDAYFSYDTFGRPNARAFTDNHGGIYVEKTTVHADGSPSTLDLFLPDTGFKQERVNYSYDSAARLRSMKFSQGATSQALYEASIIDPFGRVRKATYGDKATYAATYDDLGRRLMKEVTVSSALGARRIIYEGYDPLGRELARREIKDGAASGPQTNVAYDSLGRLSTATKTEDAAKLVNWQFIYDALGNTLGLVDFLGSGDAALSYRELDRDRVCRIGYGNDGLTGTTCNVVHDGVGNIVGQPTRTGQRKLSFFASGNVRTITEQATDARFRYDAFGEVQELDLQGGGTSDTRHDRRYGGLIERRDQTVGGTTTSFISRQVPGPGGIVASRRGAGQDWVFHFGEQRGNRFFTDVNGAFLQDVDYQPYGESKSSGAQPGSAQYTRSQWNGEDALAAFGLSHLGARLYDPVIGRFLSRDPLLVPRTAASTNPYAFAMNDPVNRSDPSGLDCIGVECQGPDGNGFPGGGPTETNWPGLYFPSGPEMPSGANPQSAYRPPPTATFSTAPAGPQTSKGRALKYMVQMVDGTEFGDAFDFDSLAGLDLSTSDLMDRIDNTPEGQAHIADYNAAIDSFSSFSAGFGDAVWFWCPGCGAYNRANLGIKSGDADKSSYLFGSITGIVGTFIAPHPTSVAAPRGSSGFSSDGAVNLASPQRTQHILLGDSTGGGHLWPGGPGKTPFPRSWSGQKIMHYVSDIATDPTLTWTRPGQTGSLFTRAGDPARFVVFGEREGIRIKVVLEPMGEGIITAYPEP